VCERDRKADLQARLHGIMQEAVPTLHTCANESRWTTHTRAVFPMHRSIPVTRISSNRDVFTAEIPARALPAGALSAIRACAESQPWRRSTPTTWPT